jgi:hypothetical protein
MVDAVFHRIPTMPTQYMHVIAGAGGRTIGLFSERSGTFPNALTAFRLRSFRLPTIPDVAP